MSNRWLRFALALIAIIAIAAAGYRIFQYEQQLVGETRALTAGTGWADTAIETVGELKAALHAYVAPGQAPDFWTSRAGTLLDKLRGALLELDRSTSSLGTPLTGTLDLSDRLAAAEQRAREYARASQPLLAGDVIFADARDQLDAIRLQVAAARGQLGQAADLRYDAIRRQQLMVAAGAAAIAVVGLLILVPPVTGRVDAAAAGESGATANPANLDEYARLVPTPKSTVSAAPAPPKPASTTAARPATAAPSTPAVSPRPATRNGGPASLVSAEVMAARSAAGLDPSHRGADSTAARATPPAGARDRVTSEPSPAIDAWPAAASLCTDIARVSDSQDVAALLTRAASLLHASGIVLWMASKGGHELAPAASSGYDDRLISRMGTISREADNLTAAAYRDAVVKTSPARGDSGAALAVPLLAPAGAVGVLSAELRDVADVDSQRQAIATILSAQLSMLLGAAPATDARKHGTDELLDATVPSTSELRG